MAQITSREELEAWLKDKPADFAQVIAARAAMRVLPYAFERRIDQEWVKKFASPLFRSIAISWAARNFPAHDMELTAAYAAARAADAAYAARAADAVTRAADAAARAANAANAAYVAANAANAAANATAWANITHDCDWLTNGGDAASASRRLTREPLWPAGEPDEWAEAWVSATGRLAALNEGYSVWIEWYDRRIEGYDAAFDIDGDHDRTEDKVILTRLADATNNDFWDKGATHANATLKGWIEEARERVAALPEQAPDIAAITAPLASPDVIVNDNRLDVVSNAILDAQSDTFDLAETISVLRSLVGTLRPCLTDNVSPIFAPSLARYDQELEERAAKPFIGVLARMEEGIEAQFYAEPDAFADGVGINFKNFFAEHRQFMSHYRNHLDREKVIAELKIDDRAASGKALTSAFDAAAKTAEELFNQGLATDGYRDEFIAQKQSLKALEYSQDIAGNKRAKLLQIVQSVGFLQQTLIASATIVATVAALPQFILAVEAAIAALSRLFV